MANATMSVLLLAVWVVLLALVLGPAYYLCRGKLTFAAFSGLPLGALLPWVMGLIVVLCAAPFVPEAKQQGYGFTPVLLMLGAGFSFFIGSYGGAFYFLNSKTFSSRAMIGAKLSSLFACIVTLYILYLGFLE